MLHFMVNAREVKTELQAGSSLVDFIRNELHLYGTKIGCREGDCGACTILVGEIENKKLKYKTMTSCLAPLGNANRKHIVTIEGINREELTVIQKFFVEANGTQCGFCTPGFVLSLYGFCLSDKEKNVENAIEAIAGNICRCTGYKSIERSLIPICQKLQTIDKKNPMKWLVDNNFLPEYFLTIEEKMNDLFPEEELEIEEDGYIVGGGTDLLIQDFVGVNDAPKINLVYGASAYKNIKIENGKCYIGSACTITQVKESPEISKIIPKMPQYLDLMASLPIRNMATVAGNIANGSPIGDLSVILMGLDATLVFLNKGKRREAKLKDFFLGYKKVAKEPEEFIEWIYFDIPDSKTFFSFEKISKRVHLDMATVNSSLRLNVDDNGNILKAAFAVGGLGPTIRYLDKMCSSLIGKKISNETFKEANRIAQTEITPRSRAEYKRSLVRQQLLIHLMSFSSSVTVEALK